MGRGGFLWIINVTSKKLKATTTNQGMTSWKFSDISSQSQERFYLEHSAKPDDDAGDVTFQLEGTTSSFKVSIHLPQSKGESSLKVDWGDITTGKNFCVFPPVSFGQLGWLNGNSLSLLIMEKGVTSSVSSSLPGEDSIVSSQPPLGYVEIPAYKFWMEYYSDQIGKLTLFEMTLPGTHDSGTYQPALAITTPWLQTQELSLSQQLDQGIRALDLRIGQNSPGDYIICHDKWKTKYSLTQALTEVRDFIDQSSKEVVLLDFHRFVNLGNGSYDYVRLKQQIASILSGYILPVSHASDTLATIWSSPGSKKGRVVVAWNSNDPESYMWPGVMQRWYQDANSLLKLYNCIKADMLTPPSTGFWAACSFQKSDLTATPISNAKSTYPTITNWYFGGSIFCEKANIISVDFFNKYSNVLQASIIANLLKAGKKA